MKRRTKADAKFDLDKQVRIMERNNRIGKRLNVHPGAEYVDWQIARAFMCIVAVVIVIGLGVVLRAEHNHRAANAGHVFTGPGRCGVHGCGWTYETATQSECNKASVEQRNYKLCSGTGQGPIDCPREFFKFCRKDK